MSELIIALCTVLGAFACGLIDLREYVFKGKKGEEDETDN